MTPAKDPVDKPALLHREQSTTPDLVELARRFFEAGNRRDFDVAQTFYGPDSVWDMSPIGLGNYQGPAAIRGFFEDWVRGYEDFEIELEELLDLGSGLLLAVVIQKGRPVGSTGEVRLRYAAVSEWVEGMIVSITNYTDIDQARAAAKRLAESRE